MTRASYDAPAPDEAEDLIRSLFGLGEVGYVALDWHGQTVMRLADGIETDTTTQTNFFEEYLLNPSLIFMAQRRGNLDCGGLRYVAVGYGDFTMLLMPIAQGNVSIGVARKRDVGELARAAEQLLVSRHVIQ